MSEFSVDNRNIDPFCTEHFVLAPELVVVGMELKFGDRVPDFCDVHHLHVHFYNGAIGTAEELERLKGEPIVCTQTDPLMPIARFVSHPGKFYEPALDPEAEEKEGVGLDEEFGQFSMENARLLNSKDDLIAYAKNWRIQLKKANNITIAKMLETLEQRATKKGLIKAAE